MNGDWRSQAFLLEHRRHRFDALHEMLTGTGTREARRNARRRRCLQDLHSIALLDQLIKRRTRR